MKPSVLKLLSREQVNQILEEATEILESPGIMIENEEAMDLLGSSGARIDEKRRTVQIPSFLIEKSLETAPRAFDVFDLQGNRTIRMMGDHIAFRPGATALNIIDPENDEYRPPRTRDLVRWVKMVEGIPVIEAQSGAMNCADVPKEIADSYRYYVMLKLG